MEQATARWFRERTYHHSRYGDLDALRGQKEDRGAVISVCIPALNEEGTVGAVVDAVRTELVERVPLVDEIVVMDSGSGDRTAAVAEEAGAAVFQDQEILPELGPAHGKGEAMWKSLFVLKGDVIVWLDADIHNFHPRFAYGTLGPLLEDPSLEYVKGFYDRPILKGKELAPSGGGRVTELMARPLINMFWPELAGFVQPLSGEYAGRREAMEQVPFFSGYGVEIGLIIDVADRFGIDRMAQVDLETRLHRNRSVGELSRMASAILQTAVTRLATTGRADVRVDLCRELIQFERRDDELVVEPFAIELRERPPARSVPGYRAPR